MLRRTHEPDCPRADPTRSKSMPCLCDLLLQPLPTERPGVDKKLYRGLLIGSVLALAIWVVALMILVRLT
jgi:hypothetical protein